MAINRCEIVKTIVVSHVGLSNVLSESPEINGAYVITVGASEIAAATRTCAYITQKLADNGFSLRDIHIMQLPDNVEMTFLVNVGEKRSL